METIRFEDLGLSELVLKAVTDMGFESASPIQGQAIPIQLEGKDIIGQAQTGTGKTAAFGIPLLEKIDPNNKKLQAIVLCPTRELAIQVAEEMRKLAKYMHGIKVLPIYGGQDIVKQIRGLKAGTQVVIGTPGRVMDHMRRKTVKMDQIHTVILDEADEMLNMGFVEDIETILSEVPQERQTIMFSATMPKEIQDIAAKFQKDPELIRVLKKELTVPRIEQFYYMMKQKDKLEVMSRLLNMYQPKLSVVFCNTKRQVDELVIGLQGKGYFAEGLHGDLKQTQRDRVMYGFRNGKTAILVATDVAARGIDVDDVEAVFNYDIPQDEEYYVHRIGRTGRAGRTGVAFNFVVGREIYKLRDIQRYCKTKIQEKQIPSLNDVRGIKINSIFSQVEKIMQEESLDTLVQAVEERIQSQEYTNSQLIAAFLKMSIGEEGEEIEDASYNVSEKKKGNTRGRKSNGRMTRLFINIGRNQGVRPGDILGAVAGESGISGDSIGSIDMYDKYTFVDVPKDSANKVCKAMKKCKIKGKSINVEIANKK